MKDSSVSHVTIQDISQETLAKVVEFLYTDKISFSPLSVSETSVVADMMRLPRLQHMCVESVQKKLNVENAIFLAKQSYLYSAEALQEICFDYFTYVKREGGGKAKGGRRKKRNER